ncbi:Vacuolar protein sorting-associated protein 8 [Sparganum proliferum]
MDPIARPEVEFIVASNSTPTHLLDEEAYPSELASVYEKIGDAPKASELARKDFLSHWAGLVACCSPSTASEAEQQSTFSHAAASLRTSADRLFALSARRCVARRDFENEGYWYAIIDLLFALRKQKQSERLMSELNSVFHSMLKAASPYVPIPSLIKRVLKLSDTSVASFGSATNTFLLQLVAVCQKELRLLRDSQRLAEVDASEGERILGERFTRGVGLRRYLCPLCGLTFSLRFQCLRGRVLFRLHEGGFTTLSRHHRPELDFEVIIFWCGHGVHMDCLAEFRMRQAGAREPAAPGADHRRKQEVNSASAADFGPPFECPFCSAPPPLLASAASASVRGPLASPSALPHPHSEKDRNPLEPLHLATVPSFLTDIQDEIRVSSSTSPAHPGSRPAHTSASLNPFDADVDM